MAEEPRVGHVDATFGGRRLRFEIPRNRSALGRLELEIGSIAAAWERFRDGRWTTSDLVAVLAASHPVEALTVRYTDARPAPMPAGRRLIQGPVGCGRMGWVEVPLSEIVGSAHGVPAEKVHGVLSGEPVATYAELAGMILTAAMFGLRESLARWEPAA